MTIHLSLIALRDLLTNYANSAALNAARAFEARQIYSGPDSDIPSRIIPADLGRELSGLDPDERIFHVQIKKVPAGFAWQGEGIDAKDKWSVADYAVVHPAADWKVSVEARLQTLEARRHVEMFNAAGLIERSRRERMIKTICGRIPIPPDTIRAVFELCRDETSLREMVAQWEKALHATIYEPIPACSQEGNQSLPEVAQDAAQGTDQATRGRDQAGQGAGSLDGEAHPSADRGDAGTEVPHCPAVDADYAASAAVPEAQPDDVERAGGC